MHPRIDASIGIEPSSKGRPISSLSSTKVDISNPFIRLRTCDLRCASNMPSGPWRQMGTRSITSTPTSSIRGRATI